MSSAHTNETKLPACPSGEPLPLQAQMVVPDQLIAGRYTLLELLGEGGMGEVWSARQEEPIKRKVAIKLIRIGSDSKAIITRFEQERQALAVMDHPNIAKVYDGGLTNDQIVASGTPASTSTALPGRPFFVMELVQGLPLVKFCDAHKLSVQSRLELFVPICRAVQHAHQKGIIHRDLKPANILVTMVDGKPLPKVIDFGVAKAISGKLTDDTLSTAMGALVGTLDYMSPEQAGLSQEDVDTRADIYALGVVLFELLTALRPFDSKRLRLAALDEMFRIIKEEEPPSLASRLSTDESLPSLAALRQCEPGRLMTQLKGELDWIVHKCLEKDRNRRYETANGLARDIERFLLDEPLEARPVSAAYRLSKFYRRNRGVVWASGLIAASVILGGLAAVWGMTRALHAEADAKEQAAIAEKERTVAIAERDEKEKARAAEARQRELAQANEKQALLESERTRAVSDFLTQDLLGMASVEHQLEEQSGFFGRDAKVRDLVDRAASKLNDRFADQPELEAELRCTIGVTYRHLGEIATAIPHLERCVEICTKQLGPNDASTLQAKNCLAVTYSQGSQIEKALVLHEAIEAALPHAPKVPDRLKMIYRANHALCVFHAGRTAEAIKMMESQNKDVEAMYGPRHDQTITMQVSYAHVLMRSGKAARAAEILEKTLPHCAAVKGEKHPTTLVARVNLGQAYTTLGKVREALALMEPALPVIMEILGPEHPNTMTAMGTLAKIYEDAMRYPESEKLFRQVLKVHQARWGINHLTSLRTENNLAVVLDKQNKLDEALRMLEHVYTERSKQLGKGHTETLLTQNNWAGALSSAGQHDRALAMHQECYQKHREAEGPLHQHTLRMLGNLAVQHNRMGQFAEACKCYEQARRESIEGLGLTHPDTIYVGHFLAETYKQLKLYDKSLALYQEVLPQFKKYIGEDHSDTIVTANNLGVVYFNLKQYDQAIEQMRWVVAARTRLQGADKPATISAQRNLADMYSMTKKFTEALAIYDVILPLMEKQRGPDHTSVYRALAEQGLCYFGLKQYEQAKGVFEQLLARQTRKLGDQHADTRQTLANVACCQVQVGIRMTKQPEDGAKLITQGTTTLGTFLTPSPNREVYRLCHQDGCQALVKYYQAAGQPSEVEKWKALAQQSEK